MNRISKFAVTLHSESWPIMELSIAGNHRPYRHYVNGALETHINLCILIRSVCHLYLYTCDIVRSIAVWSPTAYYIICLGLSAHAWLIWLISDMVLQFKGS